METGIPQKCCKPLSADNVKYRELVCALTSDISHMRDGELLNPQHFWMPVGSDFDRAIQQDSYNISMPRGSDNQLEPLLIDRAAAAELRFRKDCPDRSWRGVPRMLLT
jgi:hypothetical protein